MEGLFSRLLDTLIAQSVVVKQSEEFLGSYLAANH